MIKKKTWRILIATMKRNISSLFTDLRSIKNDKQKEKDFYKELYKILLFIPVPLNMIFSYWGQNTFQSTPILYVLMSIVVILCIYLFVYLKSNK